MLGSVKNRRAVYSEGLPDEFYIMHNPGREQPFALCKKMKYTQDRHFFQTWCFAETLEQCRAKVPWRWS